jgi:hypothetical protein
MTRGYLWSFWTDWRMWLCIAVGYLAQHAGTFVAAMAMGMGAASFYVHFLRRDPVELLLRRWQEEARRARLATFTGAEASRIIDYLEKEKP